MQRNCGAFLASMHTLLYAIASFALKLVTEGHDGTEHPSVRRCA